MKIKRSLITVFKILFSVSVTFFVIVNNSSACYVPLPSPPIAILKAIPEYVIVNRLVTLDGSDSYPYIVEYNWDFTNNSSYDYGENSLTYADGALDGITTHRYTSTGNYTAKLQVKRNNGIYDTDTCTVYVCADSDKDDLPDGWETVNFLDPNNPNDADTDLDGDGYNNLSEYLHGTDPNDGNEVPGSAITSWVPDNVGTIQRAINAAIENDTIVVKPGRYYENLCFTDKEITLSCIDPDNPYVVAATIIDGNDANNVIIFAPGDANSTVTGFTITNGRAIASQGAYSDYGGGIYCNSVSPEITNCVITRNEACVGGGGIYCINSSNATINKCVFSENDAGGYGGGIYHYNQSSSTIVNTIFIGNNAFWYGGAIYNGGNCSPVLVNCLVSKNTAGEFGGGIYNGSSSNITNCIFWGNDAYYGTLEQKQIYGGNPIVNYCCIEGLNSISGDGNIGNDPCFVDPCDPNGPDDIFATFDDGLCLEANSPCIDAADGDTAPSTDIIAQIRADINDVNNTGTGDPNYADMGAYEFPIIWYVDANAGTGGDGTSWDDAFDDLQGALSEANDGEQIWVAGGTYKPTNSNNRAISFELVEGVGIYGGFAGTEIYRYQRDWTAHPTILSGDINEPNDANDNSYHVVVGVDAATLDGFIITGGNGNGSDPYDRGAGIYCLQVSPRISNCAIVDNKAAVGSGLYNNKGCPTVTNCVFSGNNASNTGGGMYTRANLPIVRNCTFSGNEAGYGGGMRLHISAAALTVTNCIFWGNSAVSDGDEIYLSYGNPTFSYCDIKGCGGSGEGWDPEFGIDGGGNIDADPCFTDINSPAGQDGVFATCDDGLQLQTISPCIDKGDNAAADASCMTLDIIRNARKTDGDKDYEAVVDMGAYEYDTFIVKNITKGIKYNTIQAAVNAAADDDVIVVSEGTYYENVNVDNKRITLTGIDPYDPCVVEATIIDGNNNNNDVVRFQNSKSAGCIITGVTVKNSPAGYNGIHSSYDATVTNCIITANGYGINFPGEAGTITEHTITGCIIRNNQNRGVYCYSTNITLANCVIAKNASSGIHTSNYFNTLTAINCTIVGNGGYGIRNGSAFAKVANCIIWNNTYADLWGCSATYSCIQDGQFGDNGLCNIIIDPCFVSEANDDYHLIGGESWPWSPCIDSGDPSSEYFNEPNGGGGRINMGAYGNTDEAASAPNADSDGDGLPDAWEKYYWPNDDPNEHDPNDDTPDQDGFTNWTEYLFGYDPNQVTSDSMRIGIKSPLYTCEIDPLKDETVLIEYALNMDANVDIGITKTSTTQPDRTISKAVSAGVIEQEIWNGTDDNGMIVERYFYDISIDANDGDGNDCSWTPPSLGDSSASYVDNLVVDFEDFDPYKNIPVEVSCEMSDWCTRNIDIVKDGYDDDADYFLGNDKDRIYHLCKDRLLKPGWNTFYWYGRWGADVNDPNAGPDRKICEEAFDIYFDVLDQVKKGMVLVYYDEPIANLRCNPYRVIPTYDEITTITYDLPYNANVTIDIYDPDGNYFGTLVDDQLQSAGTQEVVWHGMNKDPDDSNSRYIISEGIYRVEIQRSDAADKLEGAVMVYR